MATKKRPILFSAPMVRALLAGTKTQTRRPYKVRKHPDFGCEMAASELVREEQHVIDRICPYGQPGDRLWVRESYRFTDAFDADSPARVGERCLDAGYSAPWAPIQYDADGARRDWTHTGIPPHDGPPQPGKSRPSIHMPRWASRALLEIVSVHVERLQDISEADAKAEGVERHAPACAIGRPYRIPFEVLWESINGAGGWDANPWVWVIEFRRANLGGTEP